MQPEKPEVEEKVSPGDLYKKLKNEMNTFKRTATANLAQEHDQSGSAITPNVN